ncbi:ubiquinol-cytochrome c reductase subunit 8 [Exophiala viscosa]|uniref:Cytochrome b-c1 complex subunit 8 n=1 Tax=Exophiala viscosa TaxID=2486360 RepID=A0AAN6IDN6_9EURO|nr:ubiquinol-cytochrome c reductase subunit 8 [Exophiala viscosa]KAI1626315.1 ubiquinol-cytochrome c reductase subunit 8 [Exophiala viscosa]
MRPSQAFMMQATKALRGHGADPKNGVYMGWWGNLGSPKQKGIITYSVSPNRLNPMAGAYKAAVFNTYRRTYNQILYWLPPMVLGYYLMDWAIEKNEYLNSKPGRLAAKEE